MTNLDIEAIFGMVDNFRILMEKPSFAFDPFDEFRLRLNGCHSPVQAGDCGGGLERNLEADS